MRPFLVVIRVHLKVEPLELLANVSDLHHAKEMLVGRHSFFHFVEPRDMLVGVFFGNVFVFQGSLGFGYQIVALTDLGVE